MISVLITTGGARAKLINSFDVGWRQIPFAAVNMQLLHGFIPPNQWPSGMNPCQKTSLKIDNRDTLAGHLLAATLPLR